MDSGYARRTELIHQKRRLDLVQNLKGFHVIGTRWVFRNKLNEKGEVVKNKA
jgi:hypothetical protein